MLGNTPILIAIVVAFILGWLADWAVEVYYWRRFRQQRERARVQAQLDSKEARLQELEAQLQSLRAQASPDANAPLQRAADLNAAREALAEAHRHVQEQAQQLAALQKHLAQREEELARQREQRGIGEDSLVPPEMPPTPLMLEIEDMADPAPGPIEPGTEKNEADERSEETDEIARRTAAWLASMAASFGAAEAPEKEEPDTTAEADRFAAREEWTEEDEIEVRDEDGRLEERTSDAGIDPSDEEE